MFDTIVFGNVERNDNDIFFKQVLAQKLLQIFLGLLGSAGKQILRVAEPMLVRYAKQEIERFIASRTGGSPPSDSPPSA